MAGWQSCGVAVCPGAAAGGSSSSRRSHKVGRMLAKPIERSRPAEGDEESADAPVLDLTDSPVAKMIARGRERGYVTHDELNKGETPNGADGALSPMRRSWRCRHGGAAQGAEARRVRPSCSKVSDQRRSASVRGCDALSSSDKLPTWRRAHNPWSELDRVIAAMAKHEVEEALLMTLRGSWRDARRPVRRPPRRPCRARRPSWWRWTSSMRPTLANNKVTSARPGPI